MCVRISEVIRSLQSSSQNSLLSDCSEVKEIATVLFLEPFTRHNCEGHDCTFMCPVCYYSKLFFHCGRIWKQLCTQIHHFSFLEVQNCIIHVAEKLRSRFPKIEPTQTALNWKKLKVLGRVWEGRMQKCKVMRWNGIRIVRWCHRNPNIAKTLKEIVTGENYQW